MDKFLVILGIWQAWWAWISTWTGSLVPFQTHWASWQNCASCMNTHPSHYLLWYLFLSFWMLCSLLLSMVVYTLPSSPWERKGEKEKLFLFIRRLFCLSGCREYYVCMKCHVWMYSILNRKRMRVLEDSSCFFLFSGW